MHSKYTIYQQIYATTVHQKTSKTKGVGKQQKPAKQNITATLWDICKNQSMAGAEHV